MSHVCHQCSQKPEKYIKSQLFLKIIKLKMVDKCIEFIQCLVIPIIFVSTRFYMSANCIVISHGIGFKGESLQFVLFFCFVFSCFRAMLL